MKFKWLLLPVILLAIITFWPASGPSFAPLASDARILAFGDSLTQGVGASTGMDYPSQLQRMSGRAVINAGISGETSAQGLTRFSRVLDEMAPDLIILLEGGNDFLRNSSAAQVEANLAAMLAEAQRRDIPVVLIGVPQKSIWLETAPLYGQLAAQYQPLFIEDFLTELLKLSEVKSDAIHLNDDGYRRLAEHLYRRLQQAGAL
ncbi:arylesterase [Shewanella aquimarina]|uniref:arylesterase n=1 Tax=Shewanella aquimarina TaxID=260365 RepID=UPI002014F2AC|nr:arylesterase [Shewanella aquimarina]MCL2909187.1 arylesterase [Shewanella aquimarina]